MSPSSTDNTTAAEVKQSMQSMAAGTGTMHIIVARDVLQVLLQRVQGAVAQQIQGSILSHVLIQAAQSGTAIIATNMEISAITRSAEVKVEEPGAVVLPFKMLMQMVSLSGESIDLVVAGPEAVISTDGTVWSLPTVDVDLFPDVELTTAQATPVVTKAFLKALELVYPAVCRDDSRPALTIIHLDSEGAYATDGGRAHFSKLISEFTSLDIPAAVVRLLIDMLKSTGQETVFVEETQAHVLFSAGPDEIGVRRLDAFFPPIRESMLAPREASHRMMLTLSRNRLRMALRRASIVSDDPGGTVSLVIGPKKVTIVATNSRSGRVETQEEADYNGPHRSVAYSFQSLLDLLAMVDDEMVSLRFSPQVGEGSIYFSNGNSICVVLPRVKEGVL